MSCKSYEVFEFDTLMAQANSIGSMSNATGHHNPELDIHYFYSFSSFMAVWMNFADHLLIMAITIPMVYRCYILDFEKTALHAHLCTIGFVLLMAEGVMVRYRFNAFLYNFTPDSKALMHGLMQFIGGFLGIVGTLHKYWGKEVHFKSRHAKFGLVACILSFINMIAGIVHVILPRKYVSIKLLHSVLGIFTFVVAGVAQIYGYDTGFFRRNFTNKRLWKFATFLVIVLSSIGPFKIITYNTLKLFKIEDIDEFDL